MKTYKAHIVYRGWRWICVHGMGRGAGLTPETAYAAMRANTARHLAQVLNPRPAA